MTYIITATDKRPDEIKGIVSIKTNNGLKKLYLDSFSQRGDGSLLGIAAKILDGREDDEDTDLGLLSISMTREDLIFLDTMLRRVLVTTNSKEERLRLADITRKMLYAYAPNTRPTAGVRKKTLPNSHEH